MCSPPDSGDARSSRASPVRRRLRVRELVPRCTHGLEGDGDDEPTAAVGRRVDGDGATMAIDDAAAHGKAQASAAPRSFRREEGIEDALAQLRSQALTGISHL